MALATLPSRDPEARARLVEAHDRTRPLVLARARTLTVPGPLQPLLPELVRGSVVVVEGAPGTGATSAALSLCAAATTVGEWAAVLDLEGTLGGEAGAAAGVALERFAVARRVPPDRWATAVAVLLDGMSVVVAEVPRHARAGDAHRLVARARERQTVLVPLAGPRRPWPATATTRVHVEGGPWPGLDAHGFLAARTPRVRVVDGTRERVGVLAS